MIRSLLLTMLQMHLQFLHTVLDHICTNANIQQVNETSDLHFFLFVVYLTIAAGTLMEFGMKYDSGMSFPALAVEAFLKVS